MRRFAEQWWLLAAWFLVFVGLRWGVGIDGFWNEVALSALVAAGILMVPLAWQNQDPPSR